MSDHFAGGNSEAAIIVRVPCLRRTGFLTTYIYQLRCQRPPQRPGFHIVYPEQLGTPTLIANHRLRL